MSSKAPRASAIVGRAASRVGSGQTEVRFRSLSGHATEGAEVVAELFDFPMTFKPQSSRLPLAAGAL